MNEKIEYIKDKEVVTVNEKGLFVYETQIFVYYDNFFSLANSEYNTSEFPLFNLVKSFWKTPNIQICSNLYSAPEKWLQDNDYVRYIFKKKKKK